MAKLPYNKVAKLAALRVITKITYTKIYLLLTLKYFRCDST